MYVLQANVNGKLYRFIKGVWSNSTDPASHTHFSVDTRVKFIGIDKVSFEGKNKDVTIHYELPIKAQYAAVEIEIDESSLQK